MNIYVQAFVYLFSILLGIYLGMELLGNFMFSYLRNCQTIFHNVYFQLSCQIITKTYC